MESTVRLYSPKIAEIFKFLNSIFYIYEQNTKIDRYSFIPINLTLQIMLYFHANEKKQYLYR